MEGEYSLCDSTSTNDDLENVLNYVNALSPSKKRQRSISDYVSGKPKKNPQVESGVASTQSRSKKSIIWNFFDEPKKGEKYVYCKLKNCNTKVVWSGNTSNCRHHLEKRHPSQFYAAQEQVKVVSSTSSEDGDVRASNVAVKRQPSMRSYLKNKTDAYGSNSKRKMDLDKKLTKMVIRDLQPLSIVDDVGFTEFVRELDPRYVIPSRRHLRDNLIENAFKNTTARLQSVLNGVKYVGITFDGWTSCTTQHYLTLTCHYAIEGNLKTSILSVCPLNGRATGSNLGLVVSDVLQKYDNIEVVAAVTDNAKNVIAACKELKMTNVPCAAHTLQLVVNHAINSCASTNLPNEPDESNNVCTVIKKCKDITTFFHHSSVGTKCLEDELKKRNMPVIKLQQSVETRWNSTYFMLDSINKTAEAVLFVLLSVENSIQQITPRERKMIPMVLTILKPFLDATIQLSSENCATMGLIIPCTKHILKELDEICPSSLQIPEIRHLQRQLKNYVAQYLMPYETRNIPGLCTLLDPRFKAHGFMSKDNYYRHAEKLKALLKESIAAKREVNLFSQTTTTTKPTGMFKFLNEVPATSETIHPTSQAIVHLNNYLEEAILPFNTNIIKYWQNYKGCEELKHIALKYLVVPATSVPSERANSTAGNIITDKRSRLTPLMAEKLIFLRKNFDDLKL